MTISAAEQVRLDCYNAAVEALHRADPSAVPIARFGEPYAIAKVSNQARYTVTPAERAPSPESMLMSRCIAVEDACSKLTAEAKRNSVPLGPAPAFPADLGARLQVLNNYHFELEQKLDYYSRTTLEQRRIDELMSQVAQLREAFLAQDVLLKILIAKSGEPK